ncbi:CFEM domain-containing [Pyrenophora seminiperda CCB06]|uniref:CFEM domain-containing n=1 Tax=Pyrenophora seminiperda CCB06 TaxID=1302712 RepID=A0A3M7M8A3_9PLEO|nr:CFEM domain-containing [Pyrenophora seminiperda CCB06]
MGRYAQIKVHTNVAISWLIETACAHGNDVRTVSEQGLEAKPSTLSTANTKSGRLKGKARKAAKLQEQNVDNSVETTTYEVTTEEIIRQARYLQNLGASIVMSRNAWRAFKEAVRGRQQYAEKFAQEQPQHKGNAGHIYFLDILRRVADMLSGIVQVHKTSSDQTKMQEDISFEIFNLFEALSIDQADEPMDNLPSDGQVPEISTKPSTRYKPSIKYEEDVKLHCYCFRDDVLSITSWVSKMWARYCLQGCNVKDLWRVTLLSDLAIEIIFKLEDELMKKVKTRENITMYAPGLVDNWGLAHSSLAAFQDTGGEFWQFPTAINFLNISHSELEVSGSREAIAAYGILIQYLTELLVELEARETAWETINGRQGISKASLDGISHALLAVTRAASFNLSHAIVAQLLWDVVAACGLKVEEPYHQVIQLAENCTMQYDSNGVMHPYTSRPLQEEFAALLGWTVCWPGQLSRYVKLRAIDQGHPLAALSGFHRNLWKYFDFDVKEKGHIYDDLDHHPDPEQDSKALSEHAKEFIMPPEDTNFLRKLNPLMPGKLALNLSFLHTELGLNFATDFCPLFVMCHLYNTLRQLGYLDVPWEALDKVINLHVKSLFLGKVPTEDARVMLNRFLLAYGVSPHLVRLAGHNNIGGYENDSYRLMGKPTNKTPKFEWSPKMAIVADYLHDREPMRGTLLRLEKEMAAQDSKVSGHSHTKSLLDSDCVAFLEHIHDDVAHFQQYFETDYYDLVRICGGLLSSYVPRDIQTQIQGSWSVNANECLVFTIMTELSQFSRPVRLGVPAEKHPLATHVAGFLKEYIQGSLDPNELRKRFDDSVSMATNE